MQTDPEVPLERCPGTGNRGLGWGLSRHQSSALLGCTVHTQEALLSKRGDRCRWSLSGQQPGTSEGPTLGVSHADPRIPSLRTGWGPTGPTSRPQSPAPLQWADVHFKVASGGPCAASSPPNTAHGADPAATHASHSPASLRALRRARLGPRAPDGPAVAVRHRPGASPPTPSWGGVQTLSPADLSLTSSPSWLTTQVSEAAAGPSLLQSRLAAPPVSHPAPSAWRPCSVLWGLHRNGGVMSGMLPALFPKT